VKQEGHTSLEYGSKLHVITRQSSIAKVNCQNSKTMTHGLSPEQSRTRTHEMHRSRCTERSPETWVQESETGECTEKENEQWKMEMNNGNKWE